MDNQLFTYLSTITETVSCNYKKIFKHYEPIGKIEIPNRLNKIIVFDFHGTIILPSWVSELEKTYKEIVKDRNKQRANKWALEIGRGLDIKIESLYTLAKNNGILIAKEDIKAHILKNRRIFHINQKLEIDNNLKRFIKNLYFNGHKLFILSGSGLSKEEIQNKLQIIKLDKYFSSERILSCKNNNSNKNKIFESMQLNFNDSQIIHFNDYTDGFKKVDELNGINFGIIDKSNPLQSMNTFYNSNAHYVIKNWKCWKKIINIINYST